MLERKIGGVRCRVNLLFFVFCIYVLYVDPTGITLFGFSAAFIHEGGHIFATVLLKHPPKTITISCYGICMELKDESSVSFLDMLVIASAGPIINVCCALICLVWGLPSVCSQIHFVLAVMNLLPILPLDGGRIARSLLSRFFDYMLIQKMEWVLFSIVWILLSLFGIQLALHASHNISLLIVSFYLIFLKLFYNGN